MPPMVAGVVAALQADDHLEPLLVGQLVGLHQHVEAGGVDAAGLFHEDVLAGLDGVFVVGGAEAGRRGLDDHVHAAVDRLLVGVQADEDLLRRDVGLALPLNFRFKRSAAPLALALEGVGHGHDLHVARWRAGSRRPRRCRVRRSRSGRS